MMVAVTLQVVEQDIRRDVVGVPAVPWLYSLVTLVLAYPDPLTQKPIVLEVVNGLKQRESDDRLKDHVGQDSYSEPDH